MRKEKERQREVTKEKGNKNGEDGWRGKRKRNGRKEREKEEGRGEEKKRLERGVEREVKNVYEWGKERKVCTDVETSILFLVCYG